MKRREVYYISIIRIQVLFILSFMDYNGIILAFQDLCSLRPSNWLIY